MRSVITIEENHFGHIEIDLVSARKKRKVVEYLKGFKVQANEDEALIYLQSESDRESFLSTLTRAQRDELSDGYTLRALIDSYDLLAWVGYDAADNCAI